VADFPQHQQTDDDVLVGAAEQGGKRAKGIARPQ